MAFHYTRIQFDFPCSGQASTRARIKNRVIFERADRRLDYIERRTTLLQDMPPNKRRLFAARLNNIDAISGNRPRPSMNNDSDWHLPCLLQEFESIVSLNRPTDIPSE